LALDLQQGEGQQELVLSLIIVFPLSIFNCLSLIKEKEENLVIPAQQN